MKRFLAIVCSVALAGFILAGCQYETMNSQVETAPPEDALLGSLHKVEHSPQKAWKKVYLKPEKQEFRTSEKELTFTIENGQASQLLYSYYSDLTLEIEQADGWYEIVVSEVRMPEQMLPKNSQQKITIYLEDWDYSFPSGHYRLVLSRNGAWTAGEFDLVQDAPLTVDRTRISPVLRRDAYALDSEKWMNKIILTADRSPYSLKELELQIQNNSDQQLGYGESDKFLSIQIDGNWYRIPQGSANLLALIVPPHTTQPINPMSNWEYELPSGHYRFELMLISHQNESDYLWTAVEFDLVE